MARRRNGPSVEWKISIPQELALRIELLFYDPANRKPDYGARSALITELLKTYWDSLPIERREQALGVQAKNPTNLG